MAFTQQATKPLTIPQLLCNSLKLFTKKLPHLYPTLLLYFVFSFLLTLFRSSFLQPLITSIIPKSVEIASLDPGSPEYLALLSSLIHDIKKLAFLESIYILSAFTLTSLVSVFAIHALFPKAASSLKGPMITQLYTKLFSLGLYFMALSLGLVIMFTVANRGSMMLKMVVVILGITILWLVFAWFAVVWSVGVVVSMVEEGCYGIRAITEAKKIVRGRRGQGVGLLIVEAFFPVMLAVWVYKVMIHDGSSSPSLVVLGVLEAVGVVMAVLNWAVTVVFYQDCRRSKGIEEAEGGFMYSASLPMIEHA